MADDPIRLDDPEKRARSSLFGTAPTTYEGIAEASRVHTNAATADAQASGWLPLGPRNVGGAVRCIVQHPFRDSEFLAGTAMGGLWKSTNDGYTWRPVGTDNLIGGVGSVAYAPSNPRTVYAGSGELPYFYPGGIGFFRSTDGGESFERMVDGTGASNGSAAHYAKIVVDPRDASRAWIASNRGLWRLEGDTFTREALPAAAGGNPITDVAVVPDPGNANQYLILAGVATVGIARGVFNRSSRNTAWTVIGPGAPAPWAGGVGVVRVAWSAPGAGLTGYAIMEDTNAAAAPSNASNPTVLFNSANLGVTWNAPGGGALPPEHVSNPLYSGGGVASYALALAVNPLDPRHVVVGSLDVHSSRDRGRTWTHIIDWTLYDNGDRAQHADQNVILFDRRPRNRVWVGNDGGIVFCNDCTTTPVVHVPRPGYFGASPPTPKPVWRKRSFGLSAAQLVDLTTHRLFPMMAGGGMQDNGTWVSYGGPTWYRLDGADGGALGFHPTSPFRFYTTWQSGADLVNVSRFPPVPPPPPPVLPPVDAATLPDIAPPGNVHSPDKLAMLNVATNASFFIRALEAHPNPANADFVLLGGFNAAHYATDGLTCATANLPGITGNVTSLAFATIGTDMWAGTDQGELYVNGAALPPSTGGGAQPAWTAIALPGAIADPIAAIAVHPSNSAVVAVATALGGGARGNLFLTHNRGTNWVDIRGTASALPPGPYLALAWDPASLGALFVGTASGVYIARDLPSVTLNPAIAHNPTWRTFNRGLPLVPITDLAVSPITRTLRCATFARGAFECALGSTPAPFRIPAVSLLVRNHAADDGRAYDAANTLGGDPRIGTGAAPAAAPVGAAAADAAGPIDVTRSPDIRVDSPRFTRSEAFAFGEAIDGAEHDELLVRDEPLVGDTNIVYVQVQNRGTDVATNVDVHLYFADAGNPAAAPDIAANINFPNAPAAASVWQRADMITVGEIKPGEPVVVSFQWIPPLRIRDNVALLAVVSNANDLLNNIPAGPVANRVRGERRMALHVTHVQRDTILIRDGLEDAGERGAVAWGGRSPDIIVRQGQVAAANLATEFANLAARHEDNVVRPGVNFIYVRVNNRTQTPIPNSTVRLFVVPRAILAARPAAAAPAALTLTTIPPVPGVAINNIAAGGFGIAEFSFTPAADPDPEAAAGSKGLIFLAMANVTDGAGVELDPFPDVADITDVASFWRFFTGAPLATNAALRALRFTT